MNDIVARLDALREKLSDEAFLTNKGLSNEVGLYIFAYKPAEEMAVRCFIRGLMEKQSAGGLHCRIKQFDLYEIMLDICREKRILERVPQMEKQRGQDFIMKQIQKLAPPEAYVTHMKYDGHQRGDVIFITGVGRAYPYMRSHNILNNLQHVFDDVPVVMFSPGEYTGQSLTLFGRFFDDNYYRAFNLI